MAEARDGYESHYAEKIWERVPEMYRDADGRPATATDEGGRHQLRALVEVLAGQAAVLRRSVDRVWDDQLIDVCDDWAVPYLGDLVAARLVSALDTRARRIDVANAVYYRRRAGTLRVLEEIVSDVTGWHGVVVEQFRRLGRTWHGLDPDPTERAGAITGTPPGGSADLRRPLGAQRVGGPFDEYAHTADVRRHRGRHGLYGIPELAIHLYRLQSLPVTQHRPAEAVDDRAFTVDPLGRDSPLFVRAERPVSWDDWVPSQPWQVPGPMSCALLTHAELSLTPEAVAAVTGGGLGLSAAAVADLERLRGDTYRSPADLRRALAALPAAAELLDPAVTAAVEAAALVPACGRWALLSDDGHRLPSLRVEVGGVSLPPEQVVAGDLGTWRDPPPGRAVVVDPVRGRLRFATPPGPDLRVDLHTGVVAAVGATTHSRPGTAAATASVPVGGGPVAAADGDVLEIVDSDTYGPVADVAVTTSVTVQARDRERPVLLLDADWVLDTGAAVDARLVLDGLWLTGPHDLVLRGDFAEVVLRRCTLDPGTGGPGEGVGVRVEGNVGVLRVQRCITGPVSVDAAAVVGLLEVVDSIVAPDSPQDEKTPALQARRVTLDLARTTVLGTMTALRVWVTDSLLVGAVAVTDTQSGCFRFSAAPAGSVLPHPYESATVTTADVFTTRRFPLPGYGRLRTDVGDDLARGSEQGSGLGAYAAELEPVRLDSLQAKIGEYLPIGRLPLYQHVT